MENDRTCKLEFLNLDDNEEYGSLSESDRHVLISISRYEDSPRVESAHSRPVQISTSREESVEIEFGCASEVFNSINAGKFNPSLPGSALTGSDDFSQGLGSNPLVCGGVVQQQQQHIHINNYTANLTYHAPGSTHSTPGSRPDSLGSGPVPGDPVPFANYQMNYVAPFPPVSTLPVFPLPPGHSFLLYPPFLYPQNKPQPHVPRKPEPGNLRFGAIPVVSVRHSSSDEEQEEKIHPVNGVPDKRVPERAGETIGCDVPVVKDKMCSGISNHDTEVENICREIETKDNTKLEDEHLLAKGQDQVQGLPKRDEYLMSLVHQPTPPPFPRVSQGSTDSRNSSQNESQGSSKLWSSLFSGSDPSSERIPSDKPMARIQPFSTNQEIQAGHPRTQVSQEQRAIGEYLIQHQLNHVAPSILPRGLINRSNWCFVNAILQALLACPPFFNLIKEIQKLHGSTPVLVKSITPMLDSMVEVVREFGPLQEDLIRNHKRDKSRSREDLSVGNPFEPSSVYKVLLESESFKVKEGRQEDAEEFLSCLLNMLEEEMRTLINFTHSQLTENIQVEGLEERKEPVRTPIQNMASGLIRSIVRIKSGDSSFNLQPFFTLQLDIQNPGVHSVQETLCLNFASEKIDGYVCPKSGKVTEASRTMSLEDLPPILVLHLKRMVYDGSTGGCQKVMKEISFPVDLEISRDILSPNTRTKFGSRQKQYKLFAVVYHNGLEATKGHYVSDVYHTGYSSWLHCDDGSVVPSCELNVVTSTPGSAPYILFYRRSDTLVGGEKTNK